MTQTPRKVLNEDDIYRTSTQYRLWSFSPEVLAALRAKTHELAVERAKQYGASGGGDGDVLGCLTVEEELRLVQRYCDTLRTTSDRIGWDSKVKATAVQYLKRFYLSNSCLTYPPKEIYKTVLFLASKAEAVHTDVREFGRRIATDPEIILAAEYKVMQGLRFTLDVRQPWRGLRGVLMELLSMAQAAVALPAPVQTRDGKDVQQEMLNLNHPPSGSRTSWVPPKNVREEHLADRVNAAYQAAKALLDAPALLTDAYFLYTPSQIVLASMHLADPPLTQLYLSTKLPDSSPTKAKIVATIRSCAHMLGSFGPDAVMSKDEAAAMVKKLELCRDPSTRDLVARNKELKQGLSKGGKVDEEKAKRRKLERENSLKEGNDLFGGELKKP